jgi:enterochelin esterase-like enzyme
MKPQFAAAVLVAVSFCAATRLFAAGEDDLYKLGPDSLAQDGVPHGKVVGPLTLQCEGYPGTQHTYWIYVPAQYDAAKPTALMIFNDGHAMMNPEGNVRAMNVLDNLIYRREIPTMIAVFINPGRTPEQPEPTDKDWGDRSTNRPAEYNSLDDKYARVICDELLPVLKKEYNLSPDPEQHGIAGASSGGIASFTVAWKRPEQFRKVITIVGSFTDLRGPGSGSTYADKVLAADKKPIRIFMQDGRNDNRGTGRGGTAAYNQNRDWFYQNVRLADALTKKGYDVNYAWGIGLHGQKQGGAILPEMMRWLWRDHAASTDPNDKTERSFHTAAASDAAQKSPNQN